MSRPGCVAACAYLVVALTFLWQDARTVTPGAWIGLKTIAPFLATFPISAPLAMLGMEPDLTSKANVAILLLATAGLIYWVVASASRYLPR